MQRRFGILTGGGDAPGLNAVVRAFVERMVGQLDHEVFGIEDSMNGLLPERPGVARLTPRSCRGLLARGGTVLGTTNHGDPFAWPTPEGPIDRSPEIAQAVRALGLEGLVVVGGDGSQRIAWGLMQEQGVPVLGVPKTIDNDLLATDVTFGFHTAVDVAVDALDRLATTADSHDRVLVLEVMGRDAGHIALHSGVAGGAHIVLIPEIPWTPERVASRVHLRRALGLGSALVVVAEGALPAEVAGERSPTVLRARQRAAGGAASWLPELLAPHLSSEVCVCVLGHVQRGGIPSATDRILATRLGVGAAELAHAGRWGELVALRGDRVLGVPLGEAARGSRKVDPEGALVAAARAVGIDFGS